MPHRARRDYTITVLHRLAMRDAERFDSLIFDLVSRGIWDLEELERSYERRERASSEAPRARDRRRAAYL